MLVALEGIDGSGKSTVARLVGRALRRSRRTVHVTQEPTRTWLGRAVRAGIRGRIDPMALAFLFLSDRAMHVRELRGRPRTVTITDRYRDSTTAYQAASLADEIPGALDLFARLQDRLFPAADLAILLDVLPEVGLRRIRARSRKEPFERIRFLRRVRANYLRLARQRRLLVVDATRPARAVAAEVTRLILRRLRRAGHD